MAGSKLTKALLILAGVAMAVAYTWFWTTHGFYCADGSQARQVGRWPFHQMSCAALAAQQKDGE